MDDEGACMNLYVTDLFSEGLFKQPFAVMCPNGCCVQELIDPRLGSNHDLLAMLILNWDNDPSPPHRGVLIH